MKPEIKKPTEAELEVLTVLWEEGPSTVRQVNDVLNRKKKVGYTTTLKIMQIMLGKGMLERKVVKGKHIYEACNDEQEIQSLLLERMVQSAFRGSASKLVLQALGNQKTSREELEQIRRLIDDLEKES